MTDQGDFPKRQFSGLIRAIKRIGRIEPIDFGNLKDVLKIIPVTFDESPVNFGTVIVETATHHIIPLKVNAPTFLNLKITGSPHFTAKLHKQPIVADDTPDKPDKPDLADVEAITVYDVPLLVNEYVPILDIVSNPGDIFTNPANFQEIDDVQHRLIPFEVETPNGKRIDYRFPTHLANPPTPEISVQPLQPMIGSMNTGMINPPNLNRIKGDLTLTDVDIAFNDNLSVTPNVEPGDNFEYMIIITVKLPPPLQKTHTTTLTISFEDRKIDIPLSANAGEMSVTIANPNAPKPLMELGQTGKVVLHLANFGSSPAAFSFPQQTPLSGVSVVIPFQTWTVAPFEQMNVELVIETNLLYYSKGQFNLPVRWEGSYGININKVIQRTVDVPILLSVRAPDVQIASFVQALQGQQSDLSVTLKSYGPATTVYFAATGLPDGVSIQNTSISLPSGTTKTVYLPISVSSTSTVSQTGAGNFNFTIQYSAYNGDVSDTRTVVMQIDNVFEIQPQQQSCWCWAAVTASTFDFYGGLISQCTIVDQFTAHNPANSSCCDTPLPGYCDHAGSAPDAMKWLGIHAQDINQALNLSQVTGQIDAGRPITLHIDWQGGGAHSIIVSGYVVTNAGNILLIVEDPGNGSSQTLLDINTLTSAYGGNGSWTFTHLSQPPPAPVPI
jgi:hypothetical protein